MVKANAPLFQQIPVRVDIIDRDLSVIQTIYLLGDQPKSIKDIINKDGITSKKLPKEFSELTAAKSIDGGIDWEDLDEEDFETMINTDIVEEAPVEVVTPTIAKAKAKEIIDYTISVYKEDPIIDLQKKITLLTKIDPAKQYLCMNGKSLTHYSEFKSSFDTTIDHLNILDFIRSTTTLIKGIPIDEHYLFSKESSTIINTQSAILGTFMETNVLHVTLLSLDSIITNKEAIQFLLRSDKQSFETVYDSFIERFFIMMTIQMFTAYLNNELEEFNVASYKHLVANQMQLISKLNTYPKVTTQNKDITITTNSLTLCSKGSTDTMVSLVKLFNNFIISEVQDVFYVDLLITINNKLKQIRKISKYASQAINFVENISMNVKPLAARVREYRLKDCLVITLLPSAHFSKLIISIDTLGRIEVTAYSGRSTEITKASFVEEISSYVKNIIKYLNSIKFAFTTVYQLDPNLSNYDMIKSTSKLMFSARIDYEKVIKYMTHDLDGSGLIEIEPAIAYNIKFRTFILRVGTEDNAKSIQVYSNAKLATFTLFDLSLGETAFYVDLIGRFVLYRLADIKMKLDETKGVQSIDPVLYRYKSKMNYSRICQRKFQPIVVTADDPKAVKYHNFTFNEAQYYKCPSKENAHLGFLSGYHPNGYCLPCCRKQPQGNQKNLIDQCISGELVEEAKKVKTSNRYYIIDYPNDMVANSRLVGRISNVPDSINKMLTKGTKLLINGLSVEYDEPVINMQILSIIRQYLRKNNTRDVLLLALEYLKDPTNHKKVLSMPAISYSFDNIKDLLNDLNETFMRQTIIRLEKNWNDILIDIFICMGIGIVILVDNRLKSSDCSNVINQQDECSTEPSTTLGSSLKMEKLEYVNLNNPLIMILKRIDTEYSRVNRNRRYFYFPIIFNDIIEPNVISVLPTTIEQLAKIKKITEEPITNVIDKSFDNKALIELSDKSIQIKALYSDINHNIAYADLIYKSTKSMLISLYRTPLQSDKHKVSIYKYSKNTKYTATIATALELIEIYNTKQLASVDQSGILDYLKINLNAFKSGNTINLSSTERYLLKLDKFIIYNKQVIGIKVNAIDSKRVVHSIIIYLKVTPVKEVLTILKAHRTKINAYKKDSLTKKDVTNITSMGLDMVRRSQSIVYNTELLEFKDYFVEYLQNPLELINVAPTPINYPQTQTLHKAQYMSSIYRLMVNRLIADWNKSQPTELINAIIKLVQATKPNILKSMSNNLVEDWVDKLVEEFGTTYHANVIRAEFLDLIEYLQLNIRHLTSDAIVKALKSPILPINDIEIHNLSYTSRSNIETLVNNTAKLCLQKVDTIPTTDSYLNKEGKLMILKSLYPDLLSLAISDLSNQFRREYILNDCLLNSFDNRIKLKSQIDELIYIQEL